MTDIMDHTGRPIPDPPKPNKPARILACHNTTGKDVLILHGRVVGFARPRRRTRRHSGRQLVGTGRNVGMNRTPLAPH